MLSTTGELSKNQPGPRAKRSPNKHISGAINAGAHILFLDGTAEAFLLMSQPASNHFTLGQGGALLSSLLTSWSQHCKTQFRPQSEKGIIYPAHLRSVLKPFISSLRLLVSLQLSQSWLLSNSVLSLQYWIWFKILYAEKNAKGMQLCTQGSRTVKCKWDSICPVLLCLFNWEFIILRWFFFSLVKLSFSKLNCF